MDAEDNLTVVEENAEGTLMSVTSSKRKTKYTIYKPEDGYSMFKIRVDTGVVPEQLSGYYTSRKSALNDLTYWLNHVVESKEAKWDRMFGEEKVPPLKTKEKKIASTV